VELVIQVQMESVFPATLPRIRTLMARQHAQHVPPEHRRRQQVLNVHCVQLVAIPVVAHCAHGASWARSQEAQDRVRVSSVSLPSILSRMVRLHVTGVHLESTTQTRPMRMPTVRHARPALSR